MNQEILFATHNKGKLKEARAFLSKVGYVVYGLDDLFLDEKVAESGSTYAENAYLKARAFSTLPFPVFSDDSGFEIASLGGKPGLHSARFAEELGGYDKAMDFIVGKTRQDDRALFRCTICLIEKGKGPRYFEGEVKGRILPERHGTNGFGYDPIFESEDGVRFGEASEEEKTLHSHRGRALLKLATYLAI